MDLLQRHVTGTEYCKLLCFTKSQFTSGDVIMFKISFTFSSKCLDKSFLVPVTMVSVEVDSPTNFSVASGYLKNNYQENVI